VQSQAHAWAHAYSVGPAGCSMGRLFKLPFFTSKCNIRMNARPYVENAF